MNTITRQITIGERTVSPIGLGTNRITDTPGARALLKRAVELGVGFIDTADYYTFGESEFTIGETLAPYRSGAIIATKGGMTRDARKVDGRPAYLRSALEGSLERLKLEQVYLYQLHRIDPEVPLAESVGALKQLRDEGKIAHIGLSDVVVAQIEEVRRIVPIVSVQNHYNLAERKHEPEIDFCETNGIVFIPWFPLGRGVIADTNDALSSVATKHGVTPNQIALAWLLKRSPVMLPIPGTLSIEHLEENVAALGIELTQEEYEFIGH